MGEISSVLRLVGRGVLATLLLVAGVAHFVATEEFLGQVPTFLPLREAIVIVSGVVELVLGLAVLLARGDWPRRVGWVVAVFFVAVFPGNVWQLVDGSDSFGLDTQRARIIRLPFQPLLILLALWSTGALTGLARLRRRRAAAAGRPARSRR